MTCGLWVLEPFHHSHLAAVTLEFFEYAHLIFVGLWRFHCTFYSYL